MAKVFDRHGRVNAFDEKYTGQEPTWTGDVLDSQEAIDKRFSSALNFCFHVFHSASCFASFRYCRACVICFQFCGFSADNI